MEPKENDVRCPSCRATLAVDVRTGRVMRWSEYTETDPLGRPKVTDRDWEAALGRVRSREGRAADVFESALEREKNRERELEERFDALGHPREIEPGDESRARGHGLALAIVELERELEQPTVYALDRAEALGAAHGPVRTLPQGTPSVVAAELVRHGCQPSAALGVWVRPVGALARREASPTEVRCDGLGLALAPDLEPSLEPELARARVDGALVEAERLGARHLALRCPLGAPHESWLAEQAFALSHFEQLWDRTTR